LTSADSEYFHAKIFANRIAFAVEMIADPNMQYFIIFKFDYLHAYN